MKRSFIKASKQSLIQNSQCRSPVDLDNKELIQFLRFGKTKKRSQTRQVRREYVLRSTKKHSFKTKTKDRKRANSIQIEPSKDLKSLIKKNKQFTKTKTVKKKSKTVKRVMTKNAEDTHLLGCINRKHFSFCETLKKHLNLYFRFHDMEKYAKQVKRRVKDNPMAQNNLIDVLKKHAFHNPALLNDLNRI